MTALTRTVRIYALVESDSVVRYVGYTVRTLEQRLSAHLRETRRSSSHKSLWLKSLGYTPTIVELEVTDEAGCDEAERRWIAHYRSQGADLVNKTDGGRGTLGWKQPLELVERRAAKLRGRPCAPSTREAIGTANRGKRRTVETRQVMRDLKLGKPWTEIRRRAHETKYAHVNRTIADPRFCSTCARGPFRGVRGLHRHADNSPSCTRTLEGYTGAQK